MSMTSVISNNLSVVQDVVEEEIATAEAEDKEVVEITLEMETVKTVFYTKVRVVVVVAVESMETTEAEEEAETEVAVVAIVAEVTIES